MTENSLYISTSPHVHNKKSKSVSQIMLFVIIALLPATVWGIVSFGIRALLVVLVSILTCVVTELVCLKMMKKDLKEIYDLSSVVTGLLLALCMPSSVPIYILILACVFAIAVAKMCFGGLGQNWMNPALAGRVFVMFSFSSEMSSYPMSTWTVQSITSASPNAILPVSAATPIAEAVHGYPLLYTDLFFGKCSGSIGEISALLLIIGAIFLLCTRIITWHIPVCYIVSYGFLTLLTGGDAVYGILSGGLLLGALFMATDMVTSPITHKGQIIYAIGCGFFTFLIRSYGSLPEGVSLAIILMNIATPFIDRHTKARVYGTEKKQLKLKGNK